MTELESVATCRSCVLCVCLQSRFTDAVNQKQLMRLQWTTFVLGILSYHLFGRTFFVLILFYLFDSDVFYRQKTTWFEKFHKIAGFVMLPCCGKQSSSKVKAGNKGIYLIRKVCLLIFFSCHVPLVRSSHKNPIEAS